MSEIPDRKLSAFVKGLKDAVPILLGYFGVSLAFGVLSGRTGFPAWSTQLMSLTHVSGTGQFALVKVSDAGGGLFEVLFAIVVLNIRYILMAISLAQKLSPDTGLVKRLAIAMADTDEIVAVCLKSKKAIGFAYISGLFASSYFGWNAGTFAGIFCSEYFPVQVVNALGIGLYAMFVAIIVPAAKESRPMLLCVAMAAAVNLILNFLPAAIRLNGSWNMLIAGIFSAVVTSVLFPEKDVENINGEEGATR